MSIRIISAGKMLGIRTLIYVALAVSLFSSCKAESVWSKPESWYQTGQSIDPEKVDVFYLVSTEVLSSPVEDGAKTYISKLLPEDIVGYDKENSKVRQTMFGEEFNFFSPYYHQFTMDLFSDGGKNYEVVSQTVSAEIREAFDYYMENLNGGRPFILAGFSQGAIFTIDLVKSLDVEEMSRLVAAYVIGYRLNDEDLASPNIVPAENAEDTGVTISFNSVCSPDAMWPFLTEGSATCINPISWTTDPAPVSFEYKDDTPVVQVDTAYNVLIVSDIDPEKYFFGGPGMPFGIGNLHHYDLLFYANSIRENALLRAYGKENR